MSFYPSPAERDALQPILKEFEGRNLSLADLLEAYRIGFEKGHNVGINDGYTDGERDASRICAVCFDNI